MTVADHLRKQISKSESFPYDDVTVERVQYWLCGENRILAEKPFSQEFLENVAYNSDESMKGVIWLQLKHLENL
jgi:hypothetical protein